MRWYLVLTVLLARGTHFLPAHAFVPAPIQWGGRPDQAFVLSPVPLMSEAVGPPKAFLEPGAQKLTIMSRRGASPGTIPSFRARADHAITMATPGEREHELCMEASGDKNGDTVHLNRCSGKTNQRWNFLPWGGGRKKRIQLQQTSKCLDVQDIGSLSGAAVELRECGEKDSEAWEFEELVPLPTRSPSWRRTPFLRRVLITCWGMIGFAALSLTASLWRRSRKARVAAVRNDGASSDVDQGGVCLTQPLDVSRALLSCTTDKQRIDPVVLCHSPLPEGEQAMIASVQDQSEQPDSHQGILVVQKESQPSDLVKANRLPNRASTINLQMLPEAIIADLAQQSQPDPNGQIPKSPSNSEGSSEKEGTPLEEDELKKDQEENALLLVLGQKVDERGFVDSKERDGEEETDDGEKSGDEAKSEIGEDGEGEVANGEDQKGEVANAKEKLADAAGGVAGFLREVALGGDPSGTVANGVAALPEGSTQQLLMESDDKSAKAQEPERQESESDADEQDWRSKYQPVTKVVTPAFKGTRPRRYVSADWVKNLTTLPGSLTLRRIRSPLIFNTIITVTTCAIHHFSGTWIPMWIPVPAIPHQLLTSVLSLLLVFRTNSAYDRFWEARKQLGIVTQECRELAALCTTVMTREQALPMLSLISAYPVVMKIYLRGERDTERLSAVLEAEELEALSTVLNKPQYVLARLRQLAYATSNANVNGRYVPLMIKSISELGETVSVCERIFNSPIPLHYSRHLSRFLTIFTSTLPCVLVSSFGWRTIFVMTPVSWVLFGIQEMGNVVEEPFTALDEAGERRILPLDDICNTVRDDVRAICRTSQLAKDFKLRGITRVPNRRTFENLPPGLRELLDLDPLPENSSEKEKSPREKKSEKS